MEPDSNTNTPTGHSKMKCGDMLVTCSVAGNTESGIAPVLLQPLLLFELNVHEPVKQPGKLIQDIWCMYNRFPGDYNILAISNYLFQTLHMADGGWSILNQNSFAAIKVHFGSSLSIVDAELRNLIDFLYGFMSIQLEKIQRHLTADEPSAIDLAIYRD